MGGWVGEDRVNFFGYTELFSKILFLIFFWKNSKLRLPRVSQILQQTVPNEKQSKELDWMKKKQRCFFVKNRSTLGFK